MAVSSKLSTRLVLRVITPSGNCVMSRSDLFYKYRDAGVRGGPGADKLDSCQFSFVYTHALAEAGYPPFTEASLKINCTNIM